MAVQAQYPSNVLLLNRNGQKAADDYLLQPQPGGEGGGGGPFLDESHMFFHKGGINLRKRGREGFGGGPTPTTITTAGGGGGVTTTITANPPPIHYNNNNNKEQSLLLQSQPSQLIDLSQFHHPTPNISTGLHLSFSNHQSPQLHPYPPPLHQHHQQQQNFLLSQSLLLTQDFASLVKRHRDELEQFLQAQGEELRRTLAEKRHRHYSALLLAVEESIAGRLREKEAEVEKATRRNAELKARAEQLTMEAQTWQVRARAHEAAAASLQAQLQQALVFERKAEDTESAYVDPARETTGSSLECKSCGERVARVVVLPCRHLCLCPECDQTVQACPVCLHLRNSSVEVFFC